MLTLNQIRPVATSLVRVGIVCAASWGCASVPPSLSQYLNPQFDGTRFSRVLVLADTDSLGVRRRVESRAKQWLLSWGVVAFSSNEMLFPGEETTPEKVRAAIVSKRIDSVLVISRSTGDHASNFFPPASVIPDIALWGRRVEAAAGSNPIALSTSSEEEQGHLGWTQFRFALYSYPAGLNIWLCQLDAGSGSSHSQSLWVQTVDDAATALAKRQLFNVP